MKQRTGSIASILVVALFLLLAAGVLVGPVWLELRTIGAVLKLRLFAETVPDDLSKVETIIFDLRLPRALLLILTGAALGSSGASYQGLFRNALADPFLIGVSSGAGLGAVIAQSIHWSDPRFAPFARPLFALAFGMLVVTVVFLIGRDREIGSYSSNRLILAGVAMNAFCSALISFVLLFFRNNLLTSMSWMMGGITLSGWIPIRILTPMVAVGLMGQFAFAYSINVLQFGEEQAETLGIETGKVQRRIIFFTTLTTAAAISFSGVIGFVGLIVPHVIRFQIGSDYRKILPLSALGGGVFLLAADLIARRAFAPQEFPVGLVTALTGAPFFFWLLARQGVRE